jgi:hypothetical protein
MAELFVVNETDPKVFEKKCNELLDEGFKLSSSACGFVDSAEYNFCGVYDAIFIKEESS